MADREAASPSPPQTGSIYEDQRGKAITGDNHRT